MRDHNHWTVRLPFSAIEMRHCRKYCILLKYYSSCQYWHHYDQIVAYHYLRYHLFETLPIASLLYPLSFQRGSSWGCTHPGWILPEPKVVLWLLGILSMLQRTEFVSLLSILLESATLHVIVATKKTSKLPSVNDTLNAELSHPWSIYNQCDGFQETNIYPTPKSDNSGQLIWLNFYVCGKMILYELLH